jgi:hypothetical protein
MKFFLPSLLLLPALTGFAADTNELPTLVPAYGEIPLSIWEQYHTTIITVGLVLFASASFIVWRKLRPIPVNPIPPATVAREALAKLKDQPEDGKILSVTSQIIRHYFITTFQLPPGELTTAEFYAVLAAKEQIPVELGEKVCRFLRECDALKFSTSGSSSPLQAIPRALELIQLVEQYRQPISATA